MDEVLALPTDKSRASLSHAAAARLRSGVANTIDPLGGSYFIEA